MEGMQFYTNGVTGERGDTNVHFNKPYLIRKWLPHYDWVLWLDMDALVVDLAKPVEQFIEEIGGQVWFVRRGWHGMVVWYGTVWCGMACPRLLLLPREPIQLNLYCFRFAVVRPCGECVRNLVPGERRPGCMIAFFLAGEC